MNFSKLMLIVSVVLTVSTAVLPVLGDRCGCSAHSAPRPKPSNHK